MGYALQSFLFSFSDFDSNRFTPTVAGKYLLTATIYWSVVGAGNNVILYLYKNGSLHKRVITDTQGTAESQTVTAVVDANGTTDYFEIFAQDADADTSDLSANSDLTY